MIEARKTRAVTDAQITSSYESQLPRVVAKALRMGLPRGCSDDDIRSAAAEALMKAAEAFTPGAGLWEAYAWKAMWNAAVAEVKRRIRANRDEPIEFLTDDGDASPREDRAARRPEVLAADREELQGNPILRVAAEPEVESAPRRVRKAKTRRTTKLQRVIANSPTAAEMGSHVEELRAAIYGSIKVEDVKQIVQGMVQNAKDGDVAAAKMVLGYVLGAASNVTVQSVSLTEEDTGEEGD